MIEKVEILEQSLRAVGVEAFGQFIAGSDIIDKYVASFRPQGALDHFGWRLSERLFKLDDMESKRYIVH